MSTLAVTGAPEQAAAESAAVAATGPSRAKRMVTVVIPPLVILLFVIGVWYLASEVLLAPSKRFLLPPPHSVFHDSFIDGYYRSEIFSGLWVTTKVAMVGLFISIVLGMGTAIAMSQEKWVERSIFPYAVVLQTIPVLAIVPLIGFSLGYSFRSRVFVCVLISLFPIITNTLFGLLSADRGMHDLFTLHKTSRWTRLVKLQLPAALPAIFTGFRIAAGLSVIGAVVGDFSFKQGEPGIGEWIIQYTTDLSSSQIYGAVIAASLLGVVVFVLVGIIDRRVVGRWHESTRGSR